MLFRVPVYVAQGGAGYTARPLFFPHPERRDDNLNRLLTRLARDIVHRLEVLGRQARHDEAAAWAFSPAVSAHRHAVEVELRRRKAKAKYLFVSFRHLGRRVAFTPSVPDLWFEVARNERLEDRAAAALQEHWRQAERDADDPDAVRPEADTLAGKAWVQVLGVSAHIPATPPTADPRPFLLFGGGGEPDGAAELRKVGRCLDWLYPDELDRAALRDPEVNDLVRLLAAPDRRPVLLVGPRQAGKTAVVHEAVFRRVADRKSVHVQKGNVWLVSPQRLISGMSYVGQWEGRLLAILKHSRKKDHVLYFDDVVGLFLAGLTNQSALSAAVVLKPYLEERSVRVLGEVTPEALRVLRERDRGFADLFQVVRIPEPADADALRILVGLQRRLEGKHRCAFGLDVLPAVIDFQRRYERTAAFPGKAAAVLTRLAVRAVANPDPPAGETKAGREPPRPAVTRDDVTADFVARSGLSVAFLDPKQRLDRDDVRDALQQQVVGQAEAVEALADVVSVAKARLNDPDRPLAAFLFLGPTGVGKTESAKAVARTLLGNADRLLRFDLNEYNQPGAAARLVGTFGQPEGLLTAAVRRQPFAVILLDEVEKADPEVFDLLLQVLGEGRLTDALGRTADFTNAIIILTSNLGVRESEGRYGFGGTEGDPAAFARAAERFFRPEFFNRLDRVIPFRRLSRAETARIARRLVDAVLAREGFARRTCVLAVSAAALERVIDSGYDPALGARAMKRAVERELARPAAARLAALATDELTVVTVRAGSEVPGAADGLAVDVQAPGWAAKVPAADLAGPDADRLAACRAALARVRGRVEANRPPGPVVASRVTPEQDRFYALREQVTELVATVEDLEQRGAERRHSFLETRQPEAVGRKTRYRAIKVISDRYAYRDLVQPFRSLLSAINMEEAIRELLDAAEPVGGEPDLFDLENRLALLDLMASAPPDDKPTYLWLRGPADGSADPLAARYLSAWTGPLGVETARLHPPGLAATDAVVQVSGVHARPLARTEAGTHLLLPRHGGPAPVRVDVLDRWPPELADPFAYRPILRVYPEGQAIADVRTGLVAPPPYNPDVFRAFTLAALPREAPPG